MSFTYYTVDTGVEACQGSRAVTISWRGFATP